MSEIGQTVYAINLKPRRPNDGEKTTFNLMREDNTIVLLGLTMIAAFIWRLNDGRWIVAGPLDGYSIARIKGRRTIHTAYVVMITSPTVGEGRVEFF